MSRRSITILLCLFFGFFGFHHFYLNRPALGILSCFFCWTFIPLAASFLEMFYILFATNDENFSNYAQKNNSPTAAHPKNI